MLAFFDSPVQLIVVMVVLLLVFGPQKLPEIGQQLGKALRELKKATSEFTNAIHSPDEPYHPPTTQEPYSAYDDRYDGYRGIESSGSAEENRLHQNGSSSETSQSKPPIGDFASPAMAGAEEDYIQTEHPDEAPASSPDIQPRPAEGSVPRSG